MIPVAETYHDVTVSDPYRWLENDTAAKRHRMARRAERAHAPLARRAAGARRGRRRIGKLLQSEPVARYGFQYRKQLFAFKRQPPRAQPLLVVLKPTGVVSSERTVLDPVALDPSTAARRSISTGPRTTEGTSSCRCRRTAAKTAPRTSIDVATGKRLPDVVPGVTFPDRRRQRRMGGRRQRVLLHALSAAASERPAGDRHFYQQVWFHALGTPTATTDMRSARTFRGSPRSSFTRSAGRPAICSRAWRTATAASSRYHLRDAGRQLDARSPISRTASSASCSATTASCTRRHDARTRRSAASSRSRSRDPRSPNARIVVPEGDAARPRASSPTRTRLYVTYRIGGPSRCTSSRSTASAWRGLPRRAVVGRSRSATRLDDDDVLFRTTSYVDPPRVVPLRGAAQPPRSARSCIGKPDVDFADADVVREFAVSKDGTHVPLNIIQRKGAPSSTAATRCCCTATAATASA